MAMEPTELVAWMKANKVLHYESGDTKITLSPSALVETLVGEPARPPSNKPGKVLGLTEADQIDLFLQVVERVD